MEQLYLELSNENMYKDFYLFKYESYPIKPRIMEKFMGDIKEYAKIVRLE